MEYVRNSHWNAACRPSQQAESGFFTHGSTWSKTSFVALVYIGTLTASAGAFAAAPKTVIVEGAETPDLGLPCQGSPILSAVSESRKAGPGPFNRALQPQMPDVTTALSIPDAFRYHGRCLTGFSSAT